MFAAWDVDKSASLNLTEVERGLAALGGDTWSANCDNATVLFAEADTSKNGALSEAEAGPMAMSVMGCLIYGSAACGSTAVVTVGTESFQCALEEAEHSGEREGGTHTDEAAAHVPSLALGAGEWHCEDEAHAEDAAAPTSSVGTAERWAWALLATSVVSMVALVGLLLLEGRKAQPERIPRQTADDFGALAVGAMLGAMNLHMLPEAIIEYGEPGLPWQLGVALMCGVLSAFVLEHTVVVLKGKAEVTVERMVVRGDVTPHARARDGSGSGHAGAAVPTPVEAAAATAAAVAAAEAHSQSHSHAAEAQAEASTAAPSADLAVTGTSMAAPTQGSPAGAAGAADADAAPETEAGQADTESGSTGGADADGADAGVVVVKVSGDGAGVEAGAGAGGAAGAAADGESKVEADAAPVAAGGFITTHGVVPELMHTPSAFAAVDQVVHTVFFGDLFHNSVDGLIIGVSFSSCDVAVGWAVTAAIVLHELPQEVGDYVVLRRAGLTRRTALLVNFASALGAFVGTIVALAVGHVSPQINAWLLFFTAGVLLVVALTDVMPELIHGEHGHTHGTGQGHKHSHGAGDRPHDETAGGACVHGPGAHSHGHGHGRSHGHCHRHAATSVSAKGASGSREGGIARACTLREVAVDSARQISAFVRPAFFLVLGATIVGLTTLHDAECEAGGDAGHDND